MALPTQRLDPPTRSDTSKPTWFQDGLNRLRYGDTPNSVQLGERDMQNIFMLWQGQAAQAAALTSRFRGMEQKYLSAPPASAPPGHTPLKDFRGRLPDAGKVKLSPESINGVPSESGETVLQVTSSAPPSDPVTPALGAVGDGARQMAANGALATAMAGAVAFEASQAGSAAARVVGNSVGMLLPQSTRDRLNGADELPSIAPPLPVIQLPPPDNRPTVTITQQQYLPAPPQPQSYRDPFGADTLPSIAPPQPVVVTPEPRTQTYRNLNQQSATQSARHSKYYEPNVGYRPPIGDHGNVNLADVMRVIVSAPGAPGGDDPTATDFDWCCIGKAATAAAATALII